MSEAFVHLDVRSFFSLKEGAFSPEELAVRAAELGMPAVALTDRDGLYGAARFIDACAQTGVRPILGASLTLRESGTLPLRTPSREAHVVLLARDEAGYANLCRLITDAHMLGERGDPSLTPEQVCAHAEGLVALLGPSSPPGRLATAGRFDAARRALDPFRQAFGPHALVAVEHRLEEGSDPEIRALLRLAERAELRPVATNPVRYLVPHDAFLADALECMRKIVPIDRSNVSRTNAEGWLKPVERMRALFHERPDLARTSLEVAESCSFDLGLRSMHFPHFPTPDDRPADAVLAERCERGLERRGIRPTHDVRERLHHELALIRRMGYAAYFLTVADIVADIRAIGIACACRGSAAGSLVCHLTGISDVDPVRHDLVFERFLNPMRDELPDIDIDVESARREDVYDMVLSRHGDERTACVAMIDTYRARAAVREVGKALGLPEPEVDLVAKAFPHIGANRLRDAIEQLPELAGSNLNAGQLGTLFRVAERLNGFPRHIALHPSGIVLSNDELVRRVPLERSFQGYRTIQADKDDVELLGYLKLDVLGVRMLSSIRHCLDEIARTEHVKVDLEEIPLDDEPTFELIRASDTLGCFQIESPGQRELLQKLQPIRWEDLIVDISLFRPGPVKSDMVTPYLRRRHGMERPTYAHPALRPALRETFGVIVYHEQVMRTLSAIAGYDLTEADHVRRHLDREDMLPELGADFVERAVGRGLDPELAERTWHDIVQFASFGFCKAHAAAFAVPTYRSAWLKTHYPAHFLAGVLTHDPGMYPRRLILEDAREHGIEILPLDVNASEPEYVVDPIFTDRAEVGDPSRAEGELRSGALALAAAEPTTLGQGPLPARRWRSTSPTTSAPSHRSNGERHARGEGLGPGVVEVAGSHRGARPSTAILAARGDAPTSARTNYGIRLALKDVHGISDAEIRSILVARAERPFVDVGDFLRRTTVSRPVVEALAHAGAFDALPAGSRRDRLYEAMVMEPQREGDQLTLDVAAVTTERLGLPEYSDAERVRAELEVVGLDASRHVISFFEPLLADLGAVRSRDLHRHRGGERVIVAGVKVASQTPAIRSGQRIIFLTLDDATGPVDVTVFESVQPKVAKTVFNGFVLAVAGTLRRTGIRGVSVIAEDVWNLVALNRARRDGRLTEALRGGSGSSRGGAVALGKEERAVGSAPAPRKLWHASGGSAGW